MGAGENGQGSSEEVLLEVQGVGGQCSGQTGSQSQRPEAGASLVGWRAWR